MEEPKFRNITLASGATILLGKNAEQNEILMNQFKGKEDIILHTAEPGSPFCVINKGSHSKKDISEAAVFCAAYSRDWRDNKKDVVVHIFNGKDMDAVCFFYSCYYSFVISRLSAVSAKRKNI